MAKEKSSFDGFPAATLKFLKDLKANNSRTWFDSNRATYDSALKRPTKIFCEEMTVRLEALTGHPHDAKLYRINRDLRFSKDKTPYNAHLHISFVPQAEVPSPPAWSFGFDPQLLTIGVGLFAFDKAQLELFREQVAGRSGAALEKKLAGITSRGGRIGGEPELKRVPSGFEPDHPRENLLRRKGLNVWLDFDSPRRATDADLVDRCIAQCKVAKPLFDWLWALP